MAADAAKGVQGCGPHGKCELKSRVCVCEAPWAGADCRHKRCPKNCNGRGVCGGVTPGVCQCDPFYAGDACQTFTQCASGCSDHGRCLSGGLCMCDAGWGGADCARKTCGPTGCAGLGRCVDGQCECAGRHGAACRVAPAASAACTGATATASATPAACACDAGRSGGWCQLRGRRRLRPRRGRRRRHVRVRRRLGGGGGGRAVHGADLPRQLLGPRRVRAAEERRRLRRVRACAGGRGPTARPKRHGARRMVDHATRRIGRDAARRASQ